MWRDVTHLPTPNLRWLWACDQPGWEPYDSSHPSCIPMKTHLGAGALHVAAGLLFLCTVQMHCLPYKIIVTQLTYNVEGPRWLLDQNLCQLGVRKFPVGYRLPCPSYRTWPDVGNCMLLKSSVTQPSCGRGSTLVDSSLQRLHLSFIFVGRNVMTVTSPQSPDIAAWSCAPDRQRRCWPGVSTQSHSG